LEQDDARAVIKRFDSTETIFYVDPPYLAEVRSKRWGKKAYTCEMDEASHRALAQDLQAAASSVVVSGYPSELYEDLYRGWERFEVKAQCDNQYSKVERSEVLWVKPGRTRARQLEFARHE
jgi:DNA adenine methylase